MSQVLDLLPLLFDIHMRAGRCTALNAVSSVYLSFHPELAVMLSWNWSIAHRRVCKGLDGEELALTQTQQDGVSFWPSEVCWSVINRAGVQQLLDSWFLLGQMANAAWRAFAQIHLVHHCAHLGTTSAFSQSIMPQLLSGYNGFMLLWINVLDSIG